MMIKAVMVSKGSVGIVEEVFKILPPFHFIKSAAQQYMVVLD